MRGPAAGSAVLLAAVLAAGCFEGKADVHLNPDGTGKIVGEMAFLAQSPWTGRPGKDESATELNDPQTEMKEIVGKILKSSRGVKAWKDVSFKRLEDGRIQVKGTAYFASLADLRIWPDKVKRRAAFGPEGDKVLVLVLHRPGDDADEGKRTSHRKLTADKMAARMKSMRREYNEAKGKAALQVAGLRIALRFLVPGIPDPVRGLEQDGRGLLFSTTGAELLRYMDSQVADNTVLREMAMSRESLDERNLEEALAEKVFSQKGEVWARLSGRFAKGFDYEAEVQAAKDAEKDMMAKLGLLAPRSSGPSKKPSGDSSKKDSPPKDATPEKKPPRVPMPKDPTAIPVPLFPF